MNNTEIETLPKRNLRLVELNQVEQTPRPWLLVHGLRTAFLVGILLVSVIYQIRLGNFLNVGIWLPVFATLFINFLVNSVYLLNFDRVAESGRINFILFALDAISVTALIYLTGTGQSLFLFLYLTNLVLAGFVLGADGAWGLVALTSICLSALLCVSPEVSGQGLYFSLLINNLAFVAVTALGRRLRDQLTRSGLHLREAQAEFTTLQNFNASVVDHIRVGLIVVGRSGFVQYHNPQALAVLGAPHLQQMKIQDIFPELNWPWDSLVEDGSNPFEKRDVTCERGGKTKALEVGTTRFRDADHKFRGWVFLIEDRSEEKRLEAAVRAKEKLAAVGQLAAGIAHEIRNPLASISGSIQMMLANPAAHGEDDIKLMKIVDREIDRLNGLITDFLDYARPDKKVDTPVDLNSVLREATDSLAFNKALRRDARVQLKLSAACSIPGHRDKLKQAILNLVINAYQALEGVANPLLEIETKDEGDLVILIVRDNGCGMSPANLARLFEPFHTTKPRGTGLGLAITHKILETHGARVLVESHEGSGTRFLIEFPALRSHHDGTEDLIKTRRLANG